MSEKKWYDNEISMGIMTRKYLHEGEKPEEFIPRLASIFSDEIKDDAYTLLDNAWFLPAGRTLFGAGYKGKRKLSTSNCFVAGTMVLTTNGFKPIEHVVVGDMVITSQGPRRVNNTMARHYQGDLYRLGSRDFMADIICTPNHQFLTNNGWLRADRMFGSGFAHASIKIKTTDYAFQKQYPVIDLLNYYDSDMHDRAIRIFTPTAYKLQHETFNRQSMSWNAHGSNEINRFIYMTDEFRYFIGRWIGDGSITRRRGKKDHSILQLVFNATTEMAAANRCIIAGTQAFGITPSVRTNPQQNTYIVRWENPIIGNFFYKEFGAGCEGKFLHPMYLGDLMIAIGLLDSDGSVRTHGAISITLKNKGLIEWLRLTLAMNGITQTSIHSANYGAAAMLNISAAASRKILLPFMTREYHDGRNNICCGTENADWAKVETVDVLENQDTMVFNLSVDDVHEYNVNGVICHNCYICPSVEDNIESIFNTARDMARIFSYGGGCGLAIDNLRPKGAKVNNSALESTGAVSFLNVYDTVGSVIGQNGRRGAIMIGLTCEHPDIYEYLRIKQNNEKLASMNISIKFTDKFMKAVEENRDFELHYESPETGKITNTINAGEFFDEFCNCNLDWGDPKYSWAA